MDIILDILHLSMDTSFMLMAIILLCCNGFLICLSPTYLSYYLNMLIHNT